MASFLHKAYFYFSTNGEKNISHIKGLLAHNKDFILEVVLLRCTNLVFLDVDPLELQELTFPNTLFVSRTYSV